MDEDEDEDKEEGEGEGEGEGDEDMGEDEGQDEDEEENEDEDKGEGQGEGEGEGENKEEGEGEDNDRDEDENDHSSSLQPPATSPSAASPSAASSPAQSPKENEDDELFLTPVPSPPVPSPPAPQAPVPQPPHPYVESEAEEEEEEEEEEEKEEEEDETVVAGNGIVKDKVVGNNAVGNRVVSDSNEDEDMVFGENGIATDAVTEDDVMRNRPLDNVAEEEEDEQEEGEGRKEANNGSLEGEINNGTSRIPNSQSNERSSRRTTPLQGGVAADTLANISGADLLRHISERQLRLSVGTDESPLRETVGEILSDQAVRKALEQSGGKAKQCTDRVKALIGLIDSFFTPKPYLDLKASMSNIISHTGISDIPRDDYNEPVPGYSLAGKCFDGQTHATLRALRDRWNHARSVQSQADKGWHKVNLMLSALEFYLYWEHLRTIYTSDDERFMKDRESLQWFVDRHSQDRPSGRKRVDDLKRAVAPYLGIEKRDDHTWKYMIKVGSHVAVFNKLWGLIPLVKSSKLTDVGYPLLNAAIPILLKRHPSLGHVHWVIWSNFVNPLMNEASLNKRSLDFATSAPHDASTLENACKENPLGLIGLFGYHSLQEANLPETPILTNLPRPTTPPQSSGPLTPPPTGRPIQGIVSPAVDTEASTNDVHEGEAQELSNSDKESSDSDSDSDAASTINLSLLRETETPANGARALVGARPQRDESPTTSDHSRSEAIIIESQFRPGKSQLSKLYMYSDRRKGFDITDTWVHITGNAGFAHSGRLFIQMLRSTSCANADADTL
ncbi:MAG: hypothetical protein Q9225_006817 [Loekoesia sp. 1 TL-2023]